MSKSLSVCPTCNRSYVNLTEHVTKKHSFVWLNVWEDTNDLICEGDLPVGVELERPPEELFWKDQIFGIDALDGTSDIPNSFAIMFSNGTFDASVWVFFSRENQSSPWRVDNIETVHDVEGRGGKTRTVRKDYIGRYLEIKYRRFSRPPSVTSPDSDHSPPQETGGATSAGSPA